MVSAMFAAARAGGESMDAHAPLRRQTTSASGAAQPPVGPGATSLTPTPRSSLQVGGEGGAGTGEGKTSALVAGGPMSRSPQTNGGVWVSGPYPGVEARCIVKYTVVPQISDTARQH
jgi:hypothetical protein